MLNKVQLIGRLGQDAETIGDNSGCRYSVATTRSYKDKQGNWVEETEWVNVTTWQSSLTQHLKKGTLVYVEGRLQTRKHEDRYFTSVVSSSVKLLSKKEEVAEAVPVENDLPY